MRISDWSSTCALPICLCREIAQAFRRAIVRDASAPVRGSVGRMWIDDCVRIFLLVLSRQGSATATFCGGLLMHYAAAADLDSGQLALSPRATSMAHRTIGRATV